MKLTSYVRKPFEVQAIRVTEENQEEIARWCKGEIHFSGHKGMPDEKRKPYIQVPVLNARSERQRRAYVGDWVLLYGHSFKTYPDPAFRKTFDEVVEDELVDDNQAILDGFDLNRNAVAWKTVE